MDKTTCIIVGAGPAGAACAYVLAKKGIETVMLERGRVPGEKNVASFVLFTSVLKHLIPDYLEDVPVERNIIRTDQVILGEKDAKILQSHNYRHLDDPITFSAFRSRFDAWFAQKAVDAGAELVTGMTVTDLIMEKGRVIGIKIGDDELYADVVVGADGYHSTVAEKAGLIREWAPERCWLAVKEVLDLPAEVINERFHLSDGQGSEQAIFTYHLYNLWGGATLYTNIDSISLAWFGRVDEIKQKNIKLHDSLEQFKKHPYIHAFIKGSTLREYLAHISSDGGRVKPENLYGDGVLLCGEAGAIMDTADGMGVPTCMLSGMMAAETIEMAIKKKDFSSRTLKNYLKYLDSTTLLDMIHGSRNYSNYLVGKGFKDIPDYMKAAADTYNKNWETGTEYISKEYHPLLINWYLKIGKNFTPKLLRWQITALIKISSLYSKLYEKIKSKINKRYYEWKKHLM